VIIPLLLGFSKVEGALGQLQVLLGTLLPREKKFSSLATVNDEGGFIGFDEQVWRSGATLKHCFPQC
jgi:hypothetical protein